MASWRLLGLSAALALTAATTTTGFAPAADPAAGTQRSCAVLLDHHTRTVARACADSPDARALRAIRSGNTLLVTFYEDANFGGLSTSIYGDSGPCDSSGYTLNNTGGANNLVNGTSSYRVFNSCNVSAIWTEAGENGYGSGNRTGDVPYVGDQWNDTVESMKVWNG